MEALKFTLTLKTIPVEIDGRKYTLKELTGKQRDAYLTKNSAKMKFVKGKPAGLTTFDGVQTDLLTECLFDEKNQLVTAAEMANWPAHVQEQLFTEARKLSNLRQEKQAEEDDEEQAKNV